MDLQQLVSFDQVVRSAGFTRAAIELDIAQPTLSARIQALEKEVGGKLFVRQGRRVRLSRRGEAFLPFARRSIEAIREGIEIGARAERGEAGSVTLCALESLSGSFLAPAIASYQQTHRDVALTVRAGRHEALLDLLCDGTAGLGLVSWPAGAPPDLPLAQCAEIRERVVLVAAADLPLCGRSAVSTAALGKSQPLLWMGWWPRPPSRLAALRDGAREVIDVPFATAIQLALAGAGVGFFPWLVVADLVAEGRLRTIDVRGLPPLERRSALVRVDLGAPPGPALVQLADVIRDRAASLGVLVAGPQATTT
jgi:DNA-binding transcriptional LysR family regulator